jgi:hypothetical protein
MGPPVNVRSIFLLLLPSLASTSLPIVVVVAVVGALERKHRWQVRGAEDGRQLGQG